MNTNEALELVNERVKELLENSKIGELLVKKKREEQLTDEEVKSYITMVAIATLYGVRE